MENKIQFAPKTLKDLDEISNYITVELSNPIAAKNTVKGILKSIDKLKLFPDIGVTLRLIDGISSDYRFVQYGNYLTFYRTKGMEIFVVRILYGKSDYMRILLEDSLSKGN